MSETFMQPPFEPESGFEGFDETPRTSVELAAFGGTTTADIQFYGSTARLGGNSGYSFEHGGGTVYAPLIDASFGNDEYVVMYDNVSELHGTQSSTLMQLNGTPQAGTWVDANGAVLRVLDQTANPPIHDGQIYSCDLHFAQDNGSGGPVAGTIITKPVILYSWADQVNYYDLMSGTDGDDLDGRAYENPPASPDTWEVLTGAIEIQSGRAVMDTAISSIPAMAVVEAGTEVVSIKAAVYTQSDDDFALVIRVQDEDNYWQLVLEDATSTDPVLKLNEVVSGSPTTRDSVVMTNKGPITGTQYQFMRFLSDGDDILGVLMTKDSSLYFDPDDITKDDVLWYVRYSSTNGASETRVGFQLLQDTAQVDIFYIHLVESQYLSWIDP